MGRSESSSCFYLLSKIRNKIIAENEKRGGVLEVRVERWYDKSTFGKWRAHWLGKYYRIIGNIGSLCEFKRDQLFENDLIVINIISIRKRIIAKISLLPCTIRYHMKTVMYYIIIIFILQIKELRFSKINISKLIIINGRIWF